MDGIACLHNLKLSTTLLLKLGEAVTSSKLSMSCEQIPDINSASVQGPVVPEHSVLRHSLLLILAMSLAVFVSLLQWILFPFFCYAWIHVLIGNPDMFSHN